MSGFARLAAVAAALLCCAARGEYEGRVERVCVWKGETAFVRLPGWTAKEIGEFDATEKNGVEIRLAHFEETDFLERPDSIVVKHGRDVMSWCEATGGVPSLAVVSVPEDAQSGEYGFGPLVVVVPDRTLPPPREWKCFLDLWQHPWAVARYRDVEPFSDEHFSAMRPVWSVLAQCGVKALTTTLLDAPWNHQCYDAYHSMVGRTKNADGSWTYDYSVFDKYVEFGRSCGIGPDIACYTMCPWGYVVRWNGADGATQSATARPGTAAFEEYWGPFLEDFAAHLKGKGWFEDAYIAMDERSPEDVSAIVKFVREKAPGMKIAMAGNRRPSDFKGIEIDNYSQSLQHVTDGFLSEVPARRAKGMKTTFYVCCSPSRPNTFIDSGADEAFWLGVYPALCGLDGFLRWAANSWPADPYLDASFGNWRAGDTYLVYPGGEPSSRLVNLRCGIIAGEKLRILNAGGALDAEIAELAAGCGASKAMKGEVDFRRFRERMESLVAR